MKNIIRPLFNNSATGRKNYHSAYGHSMEIVCQEYVYSWSGSDTYIPVGLCISRGQGEVSDRIYFTRKYILNDFVGKNNYIYIL